MRPRSIISGDEQREDAEQFASYAYQKADYQTAAREGERGVVLAAAAGVPLAGLDAHACWVDALRMVGHHVEALAQAEKLMEAAVALEDHGAYLRVVSGLCGIASDRGEYGVALGHYRRGLAFSRERGDRAREAWVLGCMGDMQRCLGNFQEAIDLGNEATRLYREIGMTIYEALTQLNIATAMRLNGDASGALATAMRGLEMAGHADNPHLRAAGSHVAGDVWQALGDLSEATAAYQEALMLYRSVGREMMAVECLTGLARVALLAADRDAALAHIREVAAYLDAGGIVDGTEGRSASTSRATRSCGTAATTARSICRTDTRC